MSTRCQIIIEGSDVVIYRHSDGGPDGTHGVIKSLKATLKRFIPQRGFDECYLPAHIMHDQIAAHIKWANGCIRKAKKEGRDSYVSSYEQTKFLGYGIEAYNPDAPHPFHGDIDFLYVVKKNGTIEVRECFVNPDGPSNIGNTKLLKTVKYGK